MDKRTEDRYFRKIKAADRRAEKLREPDRWERSPKVDFPLLAVTNSDRQVIIMELSKGPKKTQELIALLPFISQRLMSAHLTYLVEADLVSWKRVPKKATKIWTLNEALLADMIDTMARLDATRSERAKLRKAARRAELERLLGEIEQRVRREVREELLKEAALENLMRD